VREGEREREGWLWWGWLKLLIEFLDFIAPPSTYILDKVIII
jgi:hypothetical protein